MLYTPLYPTFLTRQSRNPKFNGGIDDIVNLNCPGLSINKAGMVDCIVIIIQVAGVYLA